MTGCFSLTCFRGPSNIWSVNSFPVLVLREGRSPMYFRMAWNPMQASCANSSLFRSFFNKGCFSGSRLCLHKSSLLFLLAVFRVILLTVLLGGGRKWSIAYSSSVCGFSSWSPPLSCEGYSLLLCSLTSMLNRARMSDGGLVRQGRTYTASAGKSPRSSVLSQSPTHQPEFWTVSPVLASSRMIRSPLENVRNDDPSPVMDGYHEECFLLQIIF